MIHTLLEPTNIDDLIDLQALSINQWGHQIVNYNAETEAEMTWQTFSLAIVGVNFDAENKTEKNSATAPDLIRSEFYKLYNWEFQLSMIDLGNVKTGETKEETYQNLAEVVQRLLNANVFPIILGGTHDLTYGQFLAYEKQEYSINMVVVDETIDLLHPECGVDSRSYLYKIFAYQPNYITNFFHLGHQHYLVDPEMVDTLEKFHFSCYRLGIFKQGNIKRLEPLVRNADLVSIDLSSIRCGDSPGQREASLHGFTSEEACALTRYVGFGDKVSSLGIYDYLPENDINNQTAKLGAQLIWHFIDGYSARRPEYPQYFDDGFLKYKVPFEEMQEIEFVKSKNDEKWWMKVPVMNGADVERVEYIPCAYEDYLKSVHYKEIPDRWLKHFMRLAK